VALMAKATKKTPVKKRAAPQVDKAQTSSDKYRQSTIRMVEGSGTRGSKARPFNNEAALAQFSSWVYSAIMLNANAIASLPIRLYTRSGGETRTAKVRRRQRSYMLGDKDHLPSSSVLNKIVELGDDFEVVAGSHPVTDLLSTVNPWLNGFGLMQLLSIYMQAVGNAYWHVVLNGLGTPAELWPMPSQHVAVVPDRDEFISGYVYGRSVETQQLFEVDEVIHFRTANPGSDGLYYGKGKIEAAWQSVSINESNHEMDLALSDNHARPDWMVIVKSGATQEQLDRFESEINRRIRGSRNSGKMLVMTGDVEAKALSFSPKDLAGRDDVVEEIAAVFGTPVSMLKANDPNLASARSGYAQWRETTVLPDAKLIEQKLNETLIPMFGLEGQAVLAFDDPVPADREFDLRQRQAAVQGGWMTPNEARSDQDLDESDDPMADKLLMNGQPLGAPPVGAIIPPAASVAVRSTKELQDGNDKAVEGDHINAVGADDAPVGRGASGDPGSGDLLDTVRPVARKQGVLVDQKSLWLGESGCRCHTKADADQDVRDEQPDAPEQRLRRAIVEVFDAVSSQIAGEPQKTIQKINADDVARILRFMEGLEQQITDAIAGPMTDMLKAGGESGLDRAGLGGGFDVTNPEVERFMRSQTTVLAGELAATTRASVERVLRETVNTGATIGQVRDMIFETGAFSGHRAEAIARTESAHAYVQGAKEAWRGSGVVKGVKWLLAPNACEFCRAVAAQFANKVQPLDAPFVTLGSTVVGTDGGRLKVNFREITGPPLHPNDRCDLIPIQTER
jgi:HK97 family phage portal protein